MDLQSKNITELWQIYEKEKNKLVKDEIIIRYLKLVKYIAAKLAVYFYDYIKFEDLVSYGIFGLIDAVEKFDTQKGVKFETYASLRIRGAIIDNIRNDDWLPRSVRQKAKEVIKATDTLKNQLQRNPTEEEIANKLNIKVEELQKINIQTNASNMLSLDDFITNNNESNFITNTNIFETSIEKQDLIERIINILQELDEKGRKIIILYYYGNLTLKEISIILGLSEARISQIHKKAIIEIQNRLKKEGGLL